MNKNIWLWLGGIVLLAILGGGGFVAYQQIEDAATRKRAQKYKATLDQINAKYGLPAGLLYWIAYQESRYRDDIITGRTLSPAGALGMFQFMPATAKELGIDPLNWPQAADGAARYLLQNFRRFHDWRLAIAAYNNGPGNVSKHLTAAGGSIDGAIAASPKETRDYVATVGAGIGVNTATA